MGASHTGRAWLDRSSPPSSLVAQTGSCSWAVAWGQDVSDPRNLGLGENIPIWEGVLGGLWYLFGIYKYINSFFTLICLGLSLLSLHEFMNFELGQGKSLTLALL